MAFDPTDPNAFGPEMLALSRTIIECALEDGVSAGDAMMEHMTALYHAMDAHVVNDNAALFACAMVGHMAAAQQHATGELCVALQDAVRVGYEAMFHKMAAESEKER